ncbi:DUF6236 family protein [Pseudomonas fulva]|uniref:DUF6236 family protein n=1 Tax=Pseudomonas fulva TaxID=47880 RepID=UPI0015E467A1|nr:DUF6236 family protein [Pseudomonas fulva]MBA1218888.1 hypothetical protein [Pseudomonas fulva]
MGQAKQRKLNDPNYGKPSKMRGLIISNPVELRGSTLIPSGGIDRQDLRSSLMYWDRLALPQNNIIGFSDNPDIDFLESSGILHKPEFIMPSPVKVETVLPDVQLLALEELEKTEKGVWSISSGRNSVISDRLTQNNGTMLQLLNAVPVPGDEVPLYEILTFKAKRRDELLRFREHFEFLSNRITTAPDSMDELKRTLEEVDSACSDLIKCTREWQYPVKLANTHASVNLDITKAASAATAVYKLLEKTPLSLSTTASSIAAAGAALLSQFKLGGDFSFQGIKRPSSPYKYAYLVQRDLS